MARLSTSILKLVRLALATAAIAGTLDRCGPGLAFAQGASRPLIAGFFPVSGAPGTSVTLDGVNLGGATEVRFNTASALFTTVSSFRLIATVPLEATSGPITVTTAFGNTVTFTHFIVAPRVLGFFPTNAAPGAVVIIEGANFTGATSVQFGGKNATTFSVVAQNQIHATVPSGALSGPISVTTLAGSGTSAANFIVTGTEPILTEFFPTNGVAGTVVTIHGRNFAGATAVKFNGAHAASFFVTAPTQISATVPSGAATGPISVSTISGTGASLAPFVVTTAPVIVDFTPAAGPPGAIVVIEGANFLGATGVKFNGTAAASFSVTASTQIRAVVPTGASSGPIGVMTPKGTGASANAFAVVTEPVIAGFAPTNGPAGTIVTIDGVNFSGLAAVQFGGVKASVFSLVSPTQIRATTPAGAMTGPINVVTALGAGASTNHFFVTASQPVITGFSPASGAPGITVTLYGLNFTGATAVRFNGAGANFSVTAPTQITCTVPPGATTGFVSVTTGGGTSLSVEPFVVAPLIASFFPTNGVPDTPVTIRGTNFTQVTAVRFAGVAAQFTNPSANEIRAFVPANAASGSISVTTPAGIVASTNAFSLLPEIIGPVKLAIQPLAGGLAALSWPAAAWRHQLQVTDRISPATWTSVTNRSSVEGDLRLVTVSRTNQTRFFRLVRP